MDWFAKRWHEIQLKEERERKLKEKQGTLFSIDMVWNSIPEIIRQTHPDLVKAHLSCWQSTPNVIWVTLSDGSMERWTGDTEYKLNPIGEI